MVARPILFNAIVNGVAHFVIIAVSAMLANAANARLARFLDISWILTGRRAIRVVVATGVRIKARRRIVFGLTLIADREARDDTVEGGDGHDKAE